MNNNYFISAFGTFGNPNGFNQSYLFVDDKWKNIAKNIKTFDLNTNAIKLFPESKVYAIRKESINGKNLIAYSIYNYAKEQNSDRSGTFIGSSILFIDKIAEENVILNSLNQFQDNLNKKNVQNNIIKVNHSENFSANKPKDFDKINYHLRKINNLNFSQTTNKQLVVFCRTTDDILQSFLKKAIDLLNIYDTIYFTNNKEVAEFVRQKRIFIAIDENGFENVIKKLEEERKRKNQEAIEELVKEKKKLEEDRKLLNDEYKTQNDINERKHRENRQKIDKINSENKNINQQYEQYLKKIDEFISRLRKGEKLDKILLLYNENKKSFSNNVDRQDNRNSLNTIANQNFQTTIDNNQTDHLNNNQTENFQGNIKNQNKDNFKIATIFLLLLWISTLIYFLVFNKSEKETIIENEPTQEEITIEEPELISIQVLNPQPNGELNENDYKLVAKKLNYNIEVKEVVKIIFKTNPTDINSHYDGQQNIYEEHLIDANKDCFENRNGIFYFTNDTLRHIPSFKK